ncbi:fatty acid desaturase [Erythrobacter rubeus]|uniref:Fatty acid desaturase n=1 Tax=Erythrobacter rubeus TaxID=2760803 RepID=A0ABR8KTD2_9SPHN|nr:fatty acid desaturase [Erythrobacter rubeus]MBD2842343.1 fatty acid desaturase [Erythrobacter rubeus]
MKTNSGRNVTTNLPSDAAAVEAADAAKPLDPRKLARDLAKFRTPNSARSWWEFAITIVPFVALFGFLLSAVSAGYYLALLATPLAGLFLLRLFIIQHDCGHGAYFEDRKTNDWLGRAIGVLTLTPYDCWRRSHALHHASTGNLDARGFGDVDTLTVREFREKSWLGRFGYRLYRHPIVLLGLGPAYLFMLRHRLPIGLMKAGSIYWISAMATNAMIAVIMIGLIIQFGLMATVLVFVPVLLTAASVGVWLFYIQHQFEDAHWDHAKEWTFHDAALLGSSYLELPIGLRWFTANIGIHHVHHLASRIPFYRLPNVLKAHPELTEVNRFTTRQTIKPLLLTLWDENRRKLVSFREAARLPA